MATIRVDGREYEVPGDKNLLAAILELGINLPYFCWHPAMGSVGACRQCAVKVYHDEHDQHGRIVMACMTPVADGLRVSVDDPEVAEFRRHVIEWLMVNHPHDCPVCDEGGECHLQDMTVMTGHVYRRYRGRKRTYRNQDLGPFINHEMNRCIACYRCVRFYRDYAGGRDLEVFASKNHVYFGRYEEGALESEFSGNLVEVCPTGVFTDKTLMRYYTRKWDFKTAPSVCVHCGLGCNTIPGERYQALRRIRARFNAEVNGYFLCDRGRYGYEFVNDPHRLRAPQAGEARAGGPAEPIREAADSRPLLQWPEALRVATEGLRGCHRVIGIGSPRASLEANFALKALVGEDAFSCGIAEAELSGIGQALAILREGPARSPSLAEVQTADAVLILGTDPTNEAPLLDLAIRQAGHRAMLDKARQLGIPDWNDYPARDAIQREHGPLFIAAAAGMKLEQIATESWRLAPPELAALAWEVEDALRGGALDGRTPAVRVARALAGAKRPLVVVSAAGDGELLRAAANIARALSGGGKGGTDGCQPLLSAVVPECNSLGATMLGGRALEEALEELDSGAADGVIVVENDLFRRAAAERVSRALKAARYVVVLDHLETPTAAQADVVLPAATFAECTGTLVNSEGRAQRFYQVFVPTGAGMTAEGWDRRPDPLGRAGCALSTVEGDCATSGCSNQARQLGTVIPTGEPAASWRIIGKLLGILRPEWAPWATSDDVLGALAESHPALAGAAEAAPPATWRDRTGAKVARATHRYSGRTAEDADKTVFEAQPPEDPDAPFTFSMEGFQGEPPEALMPRDWAPGWNSPQSRLNRFQIEVGGRARAGAPGKRLVEPGAGTGAPFSPGAPEAPLADDEIWVVARAAIFGSEELSRVAGGIASVVAPAAVRLHPDEAARRGLADGDPVRLELVGADSCPPLPLRVDPTVAAGVAVVPAGYPETVGIVGVCRGRVERAP